MIIYSKKDVANDANVAIGYQGMLAYNPLDNSLHVYDGFTPGGYVLGPNDGTGSGDLIFYQQTIQGTISNQDIYLAPLGSGAVTLTGNLRFSDSTVQTTAAQRFNQNLNTFDSPSFTAITPTTNSGALGSSTTPWNTMFLMGNGLIIVDETDTSHPLIIDNKSGALVINSGGFAVNYLGSPIFKITGSTGQTIVSSQTIIENSLNATNTSSGSLRTIGGLAVALDTYVGGTVYVDTVSSIGDGSNLVLRADATGMIQAYADQFNIWTTTNSNPVFQVNSDGDIKILAPAFDSSDGAVSIIGSADGTLAPINLPGVMLHVTGQPSTPARIYLDGASNYPAFIGRRYNGTSNTPTAASDGDTLARFGAMPFTPSGWTNISTARLTMVATENQTAAACGNEIQLWTTAPGGNVITKNLTVNSNGIVFSDGTVQNTAAIPVVQKGSAGGVATLGLDGKVTPAQLPAGGVTYRGTWSAATNTPTLHNGTGTAGDEYQVNQAGTVDFGSGPTSFNIADFVIYSGTTWQKITGTIGVSTFNSRTGAVVLNGTDVTSALGYVPYDGNVNANGYVTVAGAAAAAPVQSVFGRGGAVVMQTSDVTNVLTSGTVTNTMLAGNIPNSKLSNNTITIGSNTISLGSSTQNLLGLSNISAGNIAATNFNGQLFGNSSTASKLQYPVTINGVSFDGTQSIALVTDNVAQGSTNLYFTNAASRQALSYAPGPAGYSNISGIITIPTNTTQLTNGNSFITRSSISGGIGISYNSTTGSITNTGIVSVIGTANQINANIVSGCVTVGLSSTLVAPVYANVAHNVTILGSNSSTSYTTGALVVAGGVGIGGNLNVNGNIVATNMVFSDGTQLNSGRIVGTWTPMLLSATNSNTITYTSQTGNFVKNGQLVTAFFDIFVAGLGTASGNVFLDGLPNVSLSGSGTVGSVIHTNYSLAVSHAAITGSVLPNSTNVQLYGTTVSSGFNVGIGPIVVTDFTSGSFLRGSVNYISQS